METDLILVSLNDDQISKGINWGQMTINCVNLHPTPLSQKLVLPAVFAAGDSTMGVGPVGGAFVGVNSATGFSAFLPLVHDALTTWWGMFHSHSLVPFYWFS